MKPIVRKKNRSFAERTEAPDAVFSFLGKCPNDAFSLSEISKEVGLSKSTASAILKDLRERDLVTIEKIANIWRVRFNGTNRQAVGYKIASNLARIYSSGIIEYVLAEWGAPRSLILFGSYRKGEDAPGSDIDVAIEIDEQKDPEISGLESRKDEGVKPLREWESKHARKFSLHFFNSKRIDRNLFTNIANGIVLYGLLEARP